jgi:hypothetical protein
MNQNSFACWLAQRMSKSAAYASQQKFFASFFQKRRLSLFSLR